MTNTVCFINIGPAQRRLRWNFGIVALALGVVLVAAASLLSLPRALRLAAALFFYAGFIGVFQARAKT